MGTYYTVVNYDRREYFKPHDVNSGAKLTEMVWNAPHTRQVDGRLKSTSRGRL